MMSQKDVELLQSLEQDLERCEQAKQYLEEQIREVKNRLGTNKICLKNN